jgi:hypothetical protein
MTHIIKHIWWEKNKESKDLLITFTKKTHAIICGIVKLKKFKKLFKIDPEFYNQKRSLPHVNGVKCTWCV